MKIYKIQQDEGYCSFQYEVLLQDYSKIYFTFLHWDFQKKF